MAAASYEKLCLESMQKGQLALFEYHFNNYRRAALLEKRGAAKDELIHAFMLLVLLSRGDTVSFLLARAEVPARMADARSTKYASPVEFVDLLWYAIAGGDRSFAAKVSKSLPAPAFKALVGDVVASIGSLESIAAPPCAREPCAAPACSQVESVVRRAKMFFRV